MFENSGSFSFYLVSSFFPPTEQLHFSSSSAVLSEKKATSPIWVLYCGYKYLVVISLLRAKF